MAANLKLSQSPFENARGRYILSAQSKSKRQIMYTLNVS